MSKFFPWLCHLSPSGTLPLLPIRGLNGFLALLDPKLLKISSLFCKTSLEALILFKKESFKLLEVFTLITLLTLPRPLQIFLLFHIFLLLPLSYTSFLFFLHISYLIIVLVVLVINHFGSTTSLFIIMIAFAKMVS